MVTAPTQQQPHSLLISVEHLAQGHRFAILATLPLCSAFCSMFDAHLSDLLRCEVLSTFHGSILDLDCGSHWWCHSPRGWRRSDHCWARHRLHVNHHLLEHLLKSFLLLLHAGHHLVLEALEIGPWEACHRVWRGRTGHHSWWRGHRSSVLGCPWPVVSVHKGTHHCRQRTTDLVLQLFYRVLVSHRLVEQCGQTDQVLLQGRQTTTRTDQGPDRILLLLGLCHLLCLHLDMLQRLSLNGSFLTLHVSDHHDVSHHGIFQKSHLESNPVSKKQAVCQNGWIHQLRCFGQMGCRPNPLSLHGLQLNRPIPTALDIGIWTRQKPNARPLQEPQPDAMIVPLSTVSKTFEQSVPSQSHNLAFDLPELLHVHEPVEVGNFFANEGSMLEPKWLTVVAKLKSTLQMMNEGTSNDLPANLTQLANAPSQPVSCHHMTE